MSNTYTTMLGDEYDLSGLSAKQQECFVQAQKMIDDGVRWDAFQNWYVGPKSAIWCDTEGNKLTGLQVTRSPLYKVLQDMAGELGIQQGYLRRSDSKVNRKLDIDDFKVEVERVSVIEWFKHWAKKLVA